MRHLRLLGLVRVDQTEDDQPTEARPASSDRKPRFRSRRTIALLGYLAVEGRPMAREHLALLLWPDEEPGKGRSNLRRELYNLAKILPGCWQNDAQAIGFFPSEDTAVDIYSLRQLEKSRQWQHAAELLTGEFLEALHLSDNPRYETWLLAERERWRALSQRVLTLACNELIAFGLYAEALVYARRLLKTAPWNEDAHQKVMHLLAWTGQREAALMQYELCEQALREELEIEPSRDTNDLRRQIQRGELGIPPKPPGFLVENQAKQESARPSFVTREQELAQLGKYLERAVAGHAQVVFITGGPGRGKTALMGAFSDQALASYPDLLIARGNCDAYSGMGDAYGPFRDVLSMLTGEVEARWSAGTIDSEHARRLWKAIPLVAQAILEHGIQLLDVLVPAAPLLTRATVAEPVGAKWVDHLRAQLHRLQGKTTDTQQSHIYEQFTNVLRSVAEQQPLLLFLDDLQWVDSASNGLLFHLGRRLSEVRSRILIVCGYRPTEIVRDFMAGRHLLGKVLAEFKRTYGDVWLSLSWADETEGRRFVDALIDSEPNHLTEAFRTALHERTGGHPLFTVELLRAMQERGDLVRHGDGSWREGSQLNWQVLPAKVEAVIEERIEQLDPELQDILAVASVEGKVFTAQVVAFARNMDEASLLRRMSKELDRRFRLVQEQEEIQTGKGIITRYRFGHDLFQEFLYRRLGRGERRTIHKAVAAGLERVYEGELDMIAVQLARHYDHAGDHGNALRYFALAADYAAGVYANDEAVSHYTRAIELSSQAAVDAVTIAKLHRGRGLSHGTVGRFDRAHDDLETALSMTGLADMPVMKWRILIDLGKLWASRDYGRARGFFERALELARQMDDPSILAESLNWMGNWYANNEEAAKALVHHREAMKLFDENEDPPNLAITYDLLGIAHLLAGNFEASVEHYDRGIGLFQDLGDLRHLASSLMGRAVTATSTAFLTILPSPRNVDPFADFQAAVEIAQRIGSSPDEAWSMWPLSLLYTIQGDFGQALASCQRGLQIASNIDHREWTVGNQFALGVLLSALLAPSEALRELEKGLTMARALQSRYWINHLSGALARAHISMGDISKAEVCLDGVISNDSPMDTTGKRYCWATKAELTLSQGDAAVALDIVEGLRSSAAGMEPGRVITFLWLLKAEALSELGKPEEAVELLQVALENAGRSDERFLLWQLHGSLARLYSSIGRVDEADEEASSARAAVDEIALTIPDVERRRNFRTKALDTLSTSTGSRDSR